MKCRSPRVFHHLGTLGSFPLERFVNKKLIKAAKVVLDMAQRGIREYDAKRLLARILPEYLNEFSYKGDLALVGPDTDLKELVSTHPWLRRPGLP